MTYNEDKDFQAVVKWLAIFLIAVFICGTAAYISKRIGPLGIDVRITFDFGELVKKEK